MRSIRCFLILAGVGLIGAAPADRCRELAELNVKYATLEQRYEVEWKKERRPPEDLSQAIRLVNSQQRLIIFSMLREAEAGQQEIAIECCGGLPQDLLLQWVCVMATYLGDRDAHKLVQTMPADAAGIDSLWQLDPILGNVPPDNPLEAPLALRNQSFVNYIIARIYELVLKSHDLALSRFLSLLIRADGDYAENLEERFAQLIVQHPRVVLARWPTIRTFATHIHVGTTAFASSVNDVLRAYTNTCNTLETSPKDCQEVLGFLKQLAAQ